VCSTVGGSQQRAGTPGALPRREAIWRIALKAIAEVNSRRNRALLHLAVFVGAALLLVSALIHLHLWEVGYRAVPTVGPLFMVQTVVAALLAGMIVLVQRVVVLLAAAALQAATAAGLLLSVTVGFLGFHDGLGAPWAGTSLLVESLGGVILVAAAIALALARSRLEASPFR
jgi:hypothetical protein